MKKIASELEGIKSVAIAGHIRPDGDCVGSSMGLYNYIKSEFPKIEVDVYLEHPSSIFNYIKNFDKIDSSYEKEKSYDLFISLDSGSKDRLGPALKYFESAKKSICIDHHISNPGYGDLNYIIPDASSTSELVYELLDETKVTKDVAEAIYTGLIHDTGVFQYSNTAPRTMVIAGNLMKTGMDFTTIIEDTFYKKTYAQNQILGKTLLESTLYLDGAVVVGSLSQETMDLYHVGTGELDGIVSQLRLTKGVEVAIFLYELQELVYKVSLRSNGTVDVSKIAVSFGGGGHVKAAGFNGQGNISKITSDVIEEIKKQL